MNNFIHPNSPEYREIIAKLFELSLSPGSTERAEKVFKGDLKLDDGQTLLRESKAKATKGDQELRRLAQIVDWCKERNDRDLLEIQGAKDPLLKVWAVTDNTLRYLHQKFFEAGVGYKAVDPPVDQGAVTEAAGIDLDLEPEPELFKLARVMLTAVRKKQKEYLEQFVDPRETLFLNKGTYRTRLAKRVLG